MSRPGNKQKDWDSLKQVFSALDQCCGFLILRNHEELSEDSFYMDGHDDIDLLCDNEKKAREVLDVRNDVCWRSPCHGYIKIQGRDIKLGIRYVGDGYYDRSWEEQMIKSRRKNEKGLYVMDDEDYFYSLLYHALLQKKHLSEDYRKRLRSMAMGSGISLKSVQDCYRVLFAYMNEKGYKMVYPKDPTVPVNDRYVSKRLKKGYLEWRLRRILFTPRAMMKHFIKAGSMENG